MLYIVPHHFGGNDSFFGNRNVAGSRGHYRDDSPPVLLRIPLQHDGSSNGPILDPTHFLLHRHKLPFVGPRGENISSVLGESGKNHGHLCGGLALPKDHLRHPHPQGAVMVHLRKSQIFERQMTQACHRIIGRELPPTHFLEKLSDRLRVQGTIRHSCTRHSAKASSYSIGCSEWKAITDTPTWSKVNTRCSGWTGLSNVLPSVSRMR